MNYTVYILYSSGTDVYYKGQTSNISERLKRLQVEKKRLNMEFPGNWFGLLIKQQEVKL